MSSDVATTLLTALNFGYRKSIANRFFNFLIILPVDSAENHRVDGVYKMVTRLGGGFNMFQPIWKILVKLDHFAKVRGENKKHLKPPPRRCFPITKRFFSSLKNPEPNQHV